MTYKGKICTTLKIISGLKGIPSTLISCLVVNETAVVLELTQAVRVRALGAAAKVLLPPPPLKYTSWLHIVQVNSTPYWL